HEVIHLIIVIIAMFITVCICEYSMLQSIEWESPKHEEPKLKTYYGAAIITKDLDCSILARRCLMARRTLQTCLVPAILCVAMLRPDMFATKPPFTREYYLNLRFISSNISEIGKKQEVFKTFHTKVRHAYILARLKKYDPDFSTPLPNSKGMPRDNQLFFIPWEIADLEDK
ncbi:hypothetical protein PFISCL1PPCAC_702, partial [Pristionchus fissidentatus]